MNEDTSQQTPDGRSPDDEVPARFDALSARVKKLERAARRGSGERTKNIAAAVQSGVITLSVIVGAGWTLYTFKALRMRYKAEAEIRKLELETDVQGVVDVEVKAEQVSLPNDTGTSIKIGVQLKNVGNRNLALAFGPHALTVAKVWSDTEGRLRIASYKNPHLTYLEASKLISRDLNADNLVHLTPPELLRAGQTVSFPAWLNVQEAGLYMIEFRGALTGEELQIVQEELGRRGDTFHVVGQTFIIVQ